jgi:hypothetical protein
MPTPGTPLCGQHRSAWIRSCPQRARGTYTTCLALRDKLPDAKRTIRRQVSVKEDEEYSSTPERRYINFTGFPFPIGPILYRKTTCREVRKQACFVFTKGESTNMLICFGM